MIQKQAEWLNLKLIRTAYLGKRFNRKMVEKYPLQKDFGFYKKLNKNSKRTFNAVELEIIAELKEMVQFSITQGTLVYLFDKQFIEQFLIPALRKVNDYGEFGTKRSLNLSTVTTGFRKTFQSPFILKGMELAITELKNIKL